MELLEGALHSSTDGGSDSRESIQGLEKSLFDALQKDEDRSRLEFTPTRDTRETRV